MLLPVAWEKLRVLYPKENGVFYCVTIWQIWRKSRNTLTSIKDFMNEPSQTESALFRLAVRIVHVFVGMKNNIRIIKVFY
ncbi:hypothetical protein B7C51_15180 [Paenibacillus larvae subsp. pulvifaciens]|uniref:Uncharacterized protein n=1 Tax=Paenibacillus larvae subsp. pulvifaciens TaxID=1477 RepID=A0A1V0UUM2_9BACL|nr:hypothetical protein B7C51_15180 [Paenibacillus larvae subsp. pulvifaciens]